MDNYVGLGIAGMLLQDGVIIDNFDKDNQVIYVSIPEDSYAYHEENKANITDAESFIKRQKEVLSELMQLPNLKLKYKTYPGYWTKEQGERNFNKNIGQYTGI